MIKKNKKTDKKAKSKSGLAFRIVILAVSAILLYIIFAYRDDLKTLSHYGYLGIFVVNFISSATILLPLPGTASVFIGGAVWNPVLVGIFSGLGTAIGELFGYFLGYGGSGLLTELGGKKEWILKTEKNFKKNGAKTTFIFAFLPLPIFDIVGIIAGAVNYPVWKFFTVTLIARILRNILFAFTGTKLFG